MKITHQNVAHYLPFKTPGMEDKRRAYREFMKREIDNFGKPTAPSDEERAKILAPFLTINAGQQEFVEKETKARSESEESSAAEKITYVDGLVQYSSIISNPRLSSQQKKDELYALHDSLQPLRDDEDGVELLDWVTDAIAQIDKENELPAALGRALMSSSSSEHVQQAERESKRASSEKLEKLKAERDAAPLTPIDTSKLRSKETPRVNSHNDNNETWIRFIFGGGVCGSCCSTRRLYVVV